MSRLDELENQYAPEDWSIDEEPDRIRMIYHDNTLRQMVYLKSTLDWTEPGVDAFIVAVLMGAMHGNSKGFLSLPMPNTFSMGWGYIASKIEEDPVRWSCPDRDTFEVLRVRVKRQLAKGSLTGSGETIYGDVRDLDQRVEHGSVQLLFTSPPYLKVIKYGLYNWIRLWFLTDSGSHKEVDEVLDDTHTQALDRSSEDAHQVRRVHSLTLLMAQCGTQGVGSIAENCQEILPREKVNWSVFVT